MIEVCADWAIEDCRPFSAVAGKGFQKMAQKFIEIGAQYGGNIDIADLLPEPTTVSRCVKKRVDVEKEKLKHEIQAIVKSGQASITIDMWADAYIRRNFICATIHYIQDYNLCNIVLGIKSMDFLSSTGENIKVKLLTLLREFGVHSLTRIKYVTDRGSNVRKALQNEIRLNCSNHLLSNVVDSAFEDSDEMKSLICSCRKLVKYFKKANLQHMLTTSLKSNCPTRWNSYLNMFKSIVDNWTTINEILNNNCEARRISSINISELSGLLRICEDIDLISRKLQGCSYPTLCYVLPSIERMKLVCAPNFNDSQIISNFKAKIMEETVCKWVDNLSILHKGAQFLFPPTNRLQQDVINEIKTFCVEINNMELTNNVTSSSSSDTSSSSSNLPDQSSTPLSPTKLHTSENEIEFFFQELLRAADETVAESAAEEDMQKKMFQSLQDLMHLNGGKGKRRVIQNYTNWLQAFYPYLQAVQLQNEFFRWQETL